MRHVSGRVETLLAKPMTVAARGGPGWLVLGLACSLLGRPAFGVAAENLVREVPPAESAVHDVFYPGRGCGSRVLEVEIWYDAQESWIRHPDHPRVVADSCQSEARSRPLHQIRVRCIDPSARTDPSPWRVGLAHSRESGGDRCRDRTPDADGAGIEIESPAPGSRVENHLGQARVVGRVSFEEREAAGYEIVIAIDVSGSTWQPAGIDVDDDGILGVPLGAPPAVYSSDLGDTILAAEIQAVRILVSRLEPSLGPTRVGIVSFSGEQVRGEGGGAYTTRPPVRVESPLTDDFEQLSGVLDEILERGSYGGTNFFAAVERSVLELSGRWDAASDARPNTRKLVLLLTDGIPSPPRPGSSFADPARRVNALLATRGAHDEGIELHIYALGGRADAFPLFVRSLLHGSAGSFTRVREPGEAASFLRDLSFSALERVVIRNITTGASSPDVALTPDGHFSATVPVAPGRNEVLVTATTADGRERRREFAFDFANSKDRRRLLDVERERIRERQRWRKELEIEAEASDGRQTGDPGDQGEAGAATQPSD